MAQGADATFPEGRREDSDKGCAQELGFALLGALVGLGFRLAHSHNAGTASQSPGFRV